MSRHQHYRELAVMSGIAILFVLAIHGCGSTLRYFYSDNASYAEGGLWLRALSNFVAPAVPMFLFISGFKYAANDTQTTYFAFLRKRLPRVLMSFALINTFFWLLDSILYMESFDVVLLTKTYLHSWVGYSVAYQLWYIPMYCFIILLCPLVCRIIPSATARFCIYLAIGTLQRILEVDYPILATYPFRFISYPVFFEMGMIACQKNWRNRISSKFCVVAVGLYFLTIILISWKLPVFSANELTKYLVYYIVGSAVFYFCSILLQKSRCLQWLGKVSYPLFLCHEPFVGRYIGTCLTSISGLLPIGYLAAWIGLDLLITILLIFVIEKMKLDRILWNYKI